MTLKGTRGQGFKGSSDTKCIFSSRKAQPSALNALETQILLAGDLDLIEKGELGTLNEDIAEIERMLKALIKSLKNKPLSP